MKPKLVEKPPLVNIREDEEITTPTLIRINRRITGNSVPKSPLDVGYHRVMPLNAPYPFVLQRVVYLNVSTSIIDQRFRKIYTTCPCARKGFNNEYYIQTDGKILLL